MGRTTQHASHPPGVYSVPAGVLGAVVVVLLGLVVLLGFPDPHPPPRGVVAAPPVTTTPPAPAPASRAPSSRAPSSTAPASPGPAAVTVPAAEPAGLRATAARFTAPVRLASPASWDRWLPRGKPFPGASTAEDVATCPHLADRLGAVLGRRLSYWTGTLPAGPVGCTWATVPLSYDGPYSYAYLLSVGYLADGTTAADWRAHFYEHGGAVCPAADVPAVAAGAVLVRCEDDAGRPDLTLVLPDTRRPGVWFLEAAEQAPAPRTSADALLALVTTVRGVYG